MVKLTLRGYLGRRFGRVHKLDVADWPEAIRALRVINQEFRDHSSSVNFAKQKFAIFCDGKNITNDVKGWKSGKTIDILPIPQGAKSGGFLNIVIGAVMIGAAFWSGGATLAAWSAMQSSIAMMGGAMILGGVTQLISPQVGGSIKASVSAENKPSYAFGGAINTTAAGYPYPVPFGYRSVGGVILSASVVAEDLAVGGDTGETIR